MLVCDKCGATIVSGAKFCPQCGDPVTSNGKRSDAFSQSGVASVEIAFGYSSSANYERAVGIAAKLPTYQTEGEGKSAIHKITLPITELELLLNLYDLVGNWKSSRMLINGQPSSKSSLVHKGAGCYRQRQKSYNPQQYCFGDRDYEFNIWGCKRLGMPITTWGGGWLEYGELDRKGIWRFDKARIRHDLEQGIHENNLCPVLDAKRVLETLDDIPDTIDPRKDPNWEYVTSYQEVRGEYKEVATGIRPVMQSAKGFVLGDFSPSWDVEEREGTGKSHSIKVPIDTAEFEEARRQLASSKEKRSGCLGVMLLTIVLLAALYVLVAA